MRDRSKSGWSKEAFDLLAMASTMGMHMVSGIIVGLVIGWFLDKWLGTKPWLLLIMLMFGIAAGFLNVIRDAKHMQRVQSGTGPGQETKGEKNEPKG